MRPRRNAPLVLNKHGSNAESAAWSRIHEFHLPGENPEDNELTVMTVMTSRKMTRRRFLSGASAAIAAPYVIPRRPWERRAGRRPASGS